jgi:hypothetical protein
MENRERQNEETTTYLNELSRVSRGIGKCSMCSSALSQRFVLRALLCANGIVCWPVPGGSSSHRHCDFTDIPVQKVGIEARLKGDLESLQSSRYIE